MPSDLPENAQLSRATYGRLAAPALLEAERFVYLDADVIVNDDLSYLFEFNLAGNPVAAARSVTIPTVSSPLGLSEWKRLGLAPNTPYFNAGVLVIDRAAWQSADLTQRVLDFARDYGGDTRFLDQDAMNAVLAGKSRPCRCAGTRNICSAPGAISATSSSRRRKSRRPKEHRPSCISQPVTSRGSSGAGIRQPGTGGS